MLINKDNNIRANDISYAGSEQQPAIKASRPPILKKTSGLENTSENLKKNEVAKKHVTFAEKDIVITYKKHVLSASDTQKVKEDLRAKPLGELARQAGFKPFSKDRTESENDAVYWLARKYVMNDFSCMDVAHAFGIPLSSHSIRKLQMDAVIGGAEEHLRNGESIVNIAKALGLTDDSAMIKLSEIASQRK